MQLPEDQYEGYPGYSFSAEFPCHSVDLVLQTSSGPPASSSEPRPARPLPPPLMSCSYRPAHVHFYIGMRVKSGFFYFSKKYLWEMVRRYDQLFKGYNQMSQLYVLSIGAVKNYHKRGSPKNQDVCREGWLLLGTPGENLSLASSSFQTPLVPSVYGHMTPTSAYFFTLLSPPTEPSTTPPIMSLWLHGAHPDNPVLKSFITKVLCHIRLDSLFPETRGIEGFIQKM